MDDILSLFGAAESYRDTLRGLTRRLRAGGLRSEYIGVDGNSMKER